LEPKSERRGEAEPEASMGNRLSRAARYHSILLGRGAHRVRHGIGRIGKHRAVQGVTRAVRNRWWPNAGAGQAVASTVRRLRLPIPGGRRLQTANAEGGSVATASTHNLQRLVWDFAVVTAAVAILVVLHHQFKRPHRLLAHRMFTAATVEPSAERLSSFKRQTDDGHDRLPNESVAAADRPVDLSATNRGATTIDSTPAQSEPAANSADVPHGDANQFVAKHDDLPRPVAESPALSGQTEPVQSPNAESTQVQTREASKPPMTADSIAANPGDAPQNVDASATPTKRRHRHKTSETPVASGDSAFPNLDGPTQGAGDSNPKTATAVPALSSGPTLNSDSATTAGPNLGVTADHSTPKDAPLPPSQAVPVGAKDGATPASQSPKGDVDIFGALQDQPASKHDSKGPDFGATPPAEKPIEGAPHRRHRKNAQPEGPAPEPIRTADQNPQLDSLDASKTNGPDPGKSADPKPAEKLDPPVAPHEHELKGPDAGVNPPADQLPATEPPKRHRRRKSPPPDGATPDTLHASDSNPSPITDSKPPEPEKAAPIPAPTTVAPTNVAPVPAPDPKKSDDWSATPTSSGAPPVKKSDDAPKIDHGPDKAAPAPEHELLGTLNDEHAEKHDTVTKGPDTGALPPAVNSPPGGDEPPKHRRGKKPAEAETPGPVPAGEPAPANDHAPPLKPTDAPALVPSDAPKSEAKAPEFPAKDPKPSEPPALGGPPVAKEPPKPEPKPEPKLEAPLPPSTAPAEAPPVGGGSHPLADESQQANVSFTRSLPEKIDSGNLVTYKIVVRNNGTKLLKLVDIDEAVPADHTVRSTEPAADVHDQTLHWSVRDLAPHEATTIAITLAAPPPPQPIVPAAAHPKADRPEEDQFKTSKAEEATNLPHVELELIAPTNLRTGESCRVGFRATNLGSKMSGLKLNLDLPSQLHFAKGQKLQYKVGELDGHESREDYLTAIATAPGTVEIQGTVLLEGRTLVSAKATCKINGAAAAKQASLPRRDRFVVPASASEPQRHAAAPCCDP
jgi:hypothetical protein